MSKTESFEFLNELALAFRAAENHPRPQCAPVLEGVRAVLAHLTAAGRLIPAGGMALTAERVEDVRAAREELRGYRNFTGYSRSHVNQLIAAVDALFPATDPAEERCQSVSIFRERCALVPGHDGRHAANGCAWGYPPAPAEPAEEEMKAEALQEKIADLESQLEEEIANRDAWEQRLTNLIYSLATVGEVGEWTSSDDLDEKFIDHIGGKIQQLERAALAARGEGWYEGYEVGLEYGPIAASGEEYDGPINPYDVPASSPVVPAPTETEWATVVEIPVGAAFRPAGYTGPSYIIKTALGYRITPNGDHRLWNGAPVGTLAPFVAAEEG